MMGNKSRKALPHLMMGFSWTAVNHGRKDVIKRHSPVFTLGSGE